MKGDRFGIDWREASTWRGVVLILSALGVPFDPEQADACIAFGMAASGLIAVFFRRRPSGG